jgi:hypothetical protein
MGLELCSRYDEPGIAYFIAHAGRELGLWVARLLVGGDITVDDVDLAVGDRGATFRTEIGAMLGVPPDHPSVTIWFQTQKTLAQAAHFRGGVPPPSPLEVRDAYQQLSGLLFGRVAPYFSTHAELEALLAVARPTQEQLDRARELLLRPVQRRHFFGRLEHAAWLEPLATVGFFDPPQNSVTRAGDVRAFPWPEGQYLLRIASDDADRVTSILLRASTESQNPFVWDVTVRAANALPPAYARRLAPSLIETLRRSITEPFYSPELMQLLRKLAEAGESLAFEIAETMLWLINTRPPEMVERVPDEHMLVHSFRERRNADWMLLRLDPYGLGQFLQETVPALEALDSHRLLELLATKLDRTISVGFPERTDVPGIEVTAQSLDDGSEYWADRLDYADVTGDIRAQFAVALAGLATRLSRRGSADALLVDQVLSRFSGDVFSRIRLVTLTAAAEIAPQTAIDPLVRDALALASRFRAREVAPFLREQYDRASDLAQQAFLEGLERGPELLEEHPTIGAELESNGVTHAGDMPRDPPRNGEDTDSADRIIRTRAAIKADWQRRRLRWFHDQIPDRLQPLAASLGVTPQIPSAEDRALDEAGSYTTGVRWVAHQSPLSAETLTDMAAEEILAYARTWEPSANSSRFEEPSHEGLEQTLRAFLIGQPQRAVEIAALLPNVNTPPRYLETILGALRAGAETGALLPWPIIAAAIDFAFAESGRPASANSVTPLELFQWRGVAQDAVDLLREMCARNLPTYETAAEVWRLASLGVSSARLWSELPSTETFNASEARQGRIANLEFVAMNSLPGHAIRMLVDVALWDYRSVQPIASGDVVADEVRTEDELHARLVVAPRLEPMLDDLICWRGNAGQLARVTIGELIPWLLLTARAWVTEHAEMLFAEGASAPDVNPVWAAFVNRNPLYVVAFRDLRPWYVKAAESAPDPRVGSENSDWSISRSLAVHTLEAVLIGAAAIVDSDRFVELVFERCRVSDRARAYWVIFRSFSDAMQPPPSAFIDRIVGFWEWRIEVLEHAPDSVERREEAHALNWFLVTPYLPAADTIRLGLRTLQMATDPGHDSSPWERLAELAQYDSVGTYRLAELLILRELRRDYAFLPYPVVSPVLRAALSSRDPDTQARARRLINALGDRGLLEYGQLLEEHAPEDSYLSSRS